LHEPLFCLLLSSHYPQVAGEVAEQPHRLIPRPPSTPPPGFFFVPGESEDPQPQQEPHQPEVAAKNRPRPPWRVQHEQPQQEQQQELTTVIHLTTWGRKKMGHLPEWALNVVLSQDVSIDLTAIWDPQAVEHLRHCTGYNGTLQLRLLMMQDFRDIIFHCKSLVNHAIENNLALNLGLFCNSGRHRSVALAELLKDYLGGYVTTTVQHLTLFNPCGCPHVCQNYQGNDVRAEDALAAKLLFSRVWHHNL
jgi:hypothetical protein